MVLVYIVSQYFVYLIQVVVSGKKNGDVGLLLVYNKFVCLSSQEPGQFLLVIMSVCRLAHGSQSLSALGFETSGSCLSFGHVRSRALLGSFRCAAGYMFVILKQDTRHFLAQLAGR